MGQGVPVVMGGYYPSISPALAQRHCTSVVCGEAEPLVVTIMRDFHADCLQKRYDSPNTCDMRHLPVGLFGLVPERLVRNSAYWGIQATRGCTRGCDFCSMRQVYGRQFKKRPIDDVVREMQERGRLNYFFVDDNICLDRLHATYLFKAIRGLAKGIIIQADASIADDEWLLTAMSEAADSVELVIGVETIDNTTLKQLKNVGSVQKYQQLFETLKSYPNITADASVMFGFDSDVPETFNRTFEFLQQAKVPIVFPWILTPPPHSELHQQLRADGRLLMSTKKLLERGGEIGSCASFIPANMSAAELERRYWQFARKYYSLGPIVERMVALMCKCKLGATLTIALRNLMAATRVREYMHPMLA